MDDFGFQATFAIIHIWPLTRVLEALMCNLPCVGTRLTAGLSVKFILYTVV